MALRTGHKLACSLQINQNQPIFNGRDIHNATKESLIYNVYHNWNVFLMDLKNYLFNSWYPFEAMRIQ